VADIPAVFCILLLLVILMLLAFFSAVARILLLFNPFLPGVSAIFGIPLLFASLI
jgi:hypothetical protein